MEVLREARLAARRLGRAPGYTTAAAASLAIAIGAASTRWLESLLFEVRPLDPTTYGVVVALVLATTVAASLVPARRARRVDLVRLLREE
jgi:ABC-type lipoprotein release transport system permease subunit